MPALPAPDVARIHAYCEARTPAHLRDKVRIEVGVRGRAVTLFECHPPWHSDMPEWSRVPLAQLRYNAESRKWTLYCADRNSRLHLYDLVEPGSVDELLAEIDRDPTGIFWG